MSLRFIYGRAGTGKSHFCLEDILEKQKQKEKIYIVTPEQFSYTAEKNLLAILPEQASIYAEVLTFERMAHRIKAKVGGTTKVPLSSSGKAILMDRILTEQKKLLHFLGKSDENIELIEKQLTEFKKHGISVEVLQKVLEKVEEPYLKAKLTDMLLLYQKWEEKIEKQYIDENDTLSILAEQLSLTTEFQNAYFYLDEFAGFTQQEYKVVEILMQRAKQINVTVGTDSLILDKEQESDIFYSNKKTVQKLIEIAKKHQILIENPIYLKETKRFQNEELKHLEKNIYAVPYQAYEKNKEIENIFLFLASNAYTEIEAVAEEIENLVRKKGYRYKDIAIVTKELDNYSHLCKAIFAKYDIPIFLDEKKQLNHNNLTQYLLSIIEVFAKNWSYEAVFSYIKTGFLNIDEQEIALLENFCKKWGIKGNKWLQEWNYEEKTPQNEEKLAIIERAKKEVVEPLQKLKQKMNMQKTVEDFTRQVYFFFIENGIDKQLQLNAKQLEEEGKIELANEQKMVWDIIMGLLDEMVMVLGKEKVTFAQYSQLLKTGLKNTSLGKIPEVMDEVTIGDIDRTRTHAVKAVFIIGMNDGVFPTIYKEEGFFNDADREFLKLQGMELAKGTIERLYEDNFAIYKAFTSASEKIFLSYPSTNIEGGALRPSILISRIKKIFPNIIEKNDLWGTKESITNQKASFETLVTKMGELKEGKKIEDIWFQVYQAFAAQNEWKEKIESVKKAITKTNLPEPITKQNSEKLYGDTLHTSVSRLEQYRSCPFSYFLQYGLNLTDVSEFKVQAVDTGSFMHEVIDAFFENIRENNISYKELTEEEIKEEIDSIVEDKLTIPKNYIFKSNQKYQLIAMRLKRVIFTSMKYILQTLKNSDFEVYGNEVEFKKDKQYPPILLPLKNGKKVEITGKIDRIDIAKTSQGNYIRIIDYKSSVKNIDLNEVMAGIQIQLLTYLDATCKKENMLLAGTLYFSLLDPIVQADGHIEEESLKKEIAKRFRMQGFILADVEMVKKMDKTLEKGASSLVPAYLDKDGNLSMAKSNVVTKEEFEILQNYTNKLLQQIAEEIYTGKIAIEPFYNSKNKKTPCEYCPYIDICQFKVGENGCRYRYISKKEKEEVIQKMQNEIEGKR